MQDDNVDNEGERARGRRTEEDDLSEEELEMCLFFKTNQFLRMDEWVE